MTTTAAPFQRLVWCHERCHKSENVGRRKTIEHAARIAGASVVCLRKGRQFGEWIARAQRPPYVLVTDWREAQPCVAAVEELQGTNRPVLVVVLCNSTRQAARASAWASMVPSEVCPVRIAEQYNLPIDLLDGLIHKAFGAQTQYELPSSHDTPSIGEASTDIGEDFTGGSGADDDKEEYSPISDGSSGHLSWQSVTWEDVKYTVKNTFVTVESYDTAQHVRHRRLRATSLGPQM
eukprot:gnl/TRDRNA2_/TRDRNA2_164677_c0_seq2.p1 gnl/TRDRNA2_/TRDRNA2_164677_c0~~gnl/TRDRNA2_/TRDRNA2_164677_c0_seq2.p1  ORF type:complete len:275 (-),score=42.93 gnl/TRDRNA2_/TRDRNA2_164677_c0_seq2:18-722(-)